MPLLEIITHDKTDPEVAGLAFKVGNKQGKTVITVKDVPGFYVNRCLGPFMAECTGLLQEGVDPLTLDRTMKEFGYPVGPITLADEVGLDVAMHVNEFLAKHLGDRMLGADIGALRAMVDAGFLGRKSGKGFFTYEAVTGKFKKSDKGKEYSKETIQNRMCARFVKEAILCLQDEIIRNPVDGDIGAVFGVGFPPFRGGPFRYADQEGIQVTLLGLTPCFSAPAVTKFPCAQTLCDRMSRYADEHGPQFTPPPLLVDMAKSGKKFHNE
ncbi:HADHA [Symbiodinium sp. KB8]|nr:HADHA [Symbiodinium sp. KB8]